MTIIILCKYDRDPRQLRLVVKNGVPCPVEVCELDNIGAESWRMYKDSNVHVRPEALLARALDAVCRVRPSEPLHTIDLGTVRP